MAESTRLKKRCGLLRQELQLEGLWKRLGAGDEAFAAVLLVELLHALKVPRHERRLPAYGSIIWPEKEVGADEQLLAPSTLEEARALVTGTNSFVRRGKDGALAVECFERRIDSELEMVMLSDRCRGTIVQRTPSGVVKVYTMRDVVVYEQGVWYSKTYSSRFARRVMAAAPSAEPAVVDSVLRLAVHGLSAANIGATLVLRIDRTPNRELRGVHRGKSVSALSLNVRRPVHIGPITHLLARADGAMVLSHDGHVQRYACHLAFTDHARDAVEATGGTRHTSAKCFSFDEPETLVITVSEDGPVTVYSRGAKIVVLAPRTTDSEADPPAEQAPDTVD